MTADHHFASTGIGSYDRARWGDWVPELTDVVVQPQLSCVLQRVPTGVTSTAETIVPAIDTHHILLFWTEGAPNLNYQLDAGRQRARMNVWEGVHIRPGQSSWWESSPRSAQGVFHIHLATGLVEEARANKPKEGGRASTIGDRVTGERLKQLARMVLADAQADPSSPKLLWDSYAVLLAHQLLTSGVAAPALLRGGLAPWQTRRCIEYLTEHASHDVGLEQLAALVGLSPFHFARAFKHSTGLPPHRYQLNLRLARARKLLETTDASVTEIAFDVGYESSQALARLFRREVGVSPSDFRRTRKG